jgi:hypothetical protein
LIFNVGGRRLGDVAFYVSAVLAIVDTGATHPNVHESQLFTWVTVGKRRASSHEQALGVNEKFVFAGDAGEGVKFELSRFLNG